MQQYLLLKPAGTPAEWGQEYTEWFPQVSSCERVTVADLRDRKDANGLVWILDVSWNQEQILQVLANLPLTQPRFPLLLIHQGDASTETIAQIKACGFFCREQWSALPQTNVLKSAGSTALKTTTIRILVAEDNVINQQLIGRFLQHFGHDYVIVGNGAEAVVAVQNGDFDLVLMDCQMPVMDGFEAAAKIRLIPGRVGQVPIMAVTSNIEPGVRERCHEVGMNAYLSKPLDMHLLRQRIIELSSELPNESAHGDGPEVARSAEIDASHLNQIRELDESGEFLREMIEAFLNKLEPLIRDLIDKAGAQDMPGLVRAAHYLKGSAGNVGARALWRALSAIEESARQGNIVGVEREMRPLTALVDAVKRDFRRDWLPSEKGAA